jgi:SPP1 gp7 family putative phage head morphogenesis protein
MEKVVCKAEYTMSKNPLKLDPSRTAGLRKRYAAEMKRKFGAIRKALVEWVGVDDALELKPQSSLVVFNAYQFPTAEARSAAFQAWLQKQVDAELLTVTSEGAKWTQKYVGSAYRQGVLRTYADTHKKEKLKGDKWYQGGQSAFLADAFGGPEMLSKVRMLATRNFTQLKDVSSTMSSQLDMILADGMANGKGPREIARDMAKRVDGITKKRALVIARTEIIHAHAEGQLDSMEVLGVDKATAAVEFATAGDDRVCPRCAALEGKEYTIKQAHGVIPVHPNCRCAWIPLVATPSKEAAAEADKTLDAFLNAPIEVYER